MSSIAGRWESDFGLVVLAQEGTEVVGSYPRFVGTLAGTVDGTKLDLAWSDPQNGIGWWAAELSADALHLHGSWGAHSEALPRGPWNAHRVPVRDLPREVVTGWRVEGEIAGTRLLGFARLAAEGGRLEGRLEGVLRSEDVAGAPVEVAVIDRLEGSCVEGARTLFWVDPINGSSDPLELTPTEDGWAGAWMSADGEVSLRLIADMEAVARVGLDLDHWLLGVAYLDEGWRRVSAQRLLDALAAFREAGKRLALAGFPAKLAAAFYGQGHCHECLGELDAARAGYLAARALMPLGEASHDAVQVALDRLEAGLAAAVGSGTLATATQVDVASGALASVDPRVDLKWEALRALVSGDVERAAALLAEGLPQTEAWLAEPGRNQRASRIELATVLGLAGLVATRRGQPEDAATHHLRALTLWRELGARAGLAAELRRLAMARADSGLPEEAGRLLAQAREIQEDIEDPGRWMTHRQLAQLAHSQGRAEDALAAYEACLRELERLHGEQWTEQTKAHLPYWLWLGYSEQTPVAEYLGALYDLDPARHSLRALTIAERGRARTLADSVTRFQAGEPPPPAATPAPDFGRYLPETVAAVDEDTLVGLVRDRRLACLVYFVTGKCTYGWAIRPDGAVRWQRLTLALDEVEERTRRLGESLTILAARDRSDRNLDPAGSRLVPPTLDPTPDLAALFAGLVEPFWDFLTADGRPARLVLVPHGPLHGVPFVALRRGEDHPLLSTTLTYSPSLTVLHHLRTTRTRPLRRALFVARPTGAENLTHALAEVEEVAKSPRLDSLILTGPQATKARILAEAEAFDILHFATHGKEVSSGRRRFVLQLADGELGEEDLVSLDLSGRLVALSACDTHRGDRLAGDELMSLARGFLAAGATTVIATLWEVDDRATADVFIAFYAALLAGADPPTALVAAQRTYLEQAPQERRRRPELWAPFVAIGR